MKNLGKNFIERKKIIGTKQMSKQNFALNNRISN